jgi:hypothetical protein
MSLMHTLGVSRLVTHVEVRGIINHLFGTMKYHHKEDNSEIH